MSGTDQRLWEKKSDCIRVRFWIDRCRWLCSCGSIELPHTSSVLRCSLSTRHTHQHHEMVSHEYYQVPECDHATHSEVSTASVSALLRTMWRTVLCNDTCVNQCFWCVLTLHLSYNDGATRCGGGVPRPTWVPLWGSVISLLCTSTSHGHSHDRWSYQWYQVVDTSWLYTTRCIWSLSQLNSWYRWYQHRWWHRCHSRYTSTYDDDVHHRYLLLWSQLVSLHQMHTI